MKVTARLKSDVLCKLLDLLFAAIVGRLGTAPLGAVGLSTLLFMFSNLFFNFLTVVTTSDVANAAAQNDFAEVGSCSCLHLLWRTADSFTFTAAVPTVLVCIFLAGVKEHIASNVCGTCVWHAAYWLAVDILAAAHDT